MFRSFVPERDPVEYGLTTNIHTYNPVKVAWHEFYAIGSDVRSADRWTDRLRFTFGHPGWHPAGAMQQAESGAERLSAEA